MSIVVRWASFALRNGAFNAQIRLNLVCVLDHDTIDWLFERIVVSCHFLVNKQSISWFSKCLQVCHLKLGQQNGLWQWHLRGWLRLLILELYFFVLWECLDLILQVEAILFHSFSRKIVFAFFFWFFIGPLSDVFSACWGEQWLACSAAS